jgi:hypothetical protein
MSFYSGSICHYLPLLEYSEGHCAALITPDLVVPFTHQVSKHRTILLTHCTVHVCDLKREPKTLMRAESILRFAGVSLGDPLIT